MAAKELAETLSERGLRPTQQRVAVYGYLLSHPTHPTAECIFQAIRAEYPVFSRTTIYNTLRALTQAGLVRVVNMDAQEQRFDGNVSDHAHFKCSVCGKIYDFEMDKRLVQQVCPPDFAVEISDVYFGGVCAICRRKTSVPNKA